MATIFHLALASDWRTAEADGHYLVSTRGATLAEVGFIHASRGDQWPRIREAFYADVTEPLLLLQIDTELLAVPVVEEPAEPGAAETFPHIYGPLPVAAVVRAIPLDQSTPSRPVAAAKQTPATSDEPAAGGGPSFAALYFREMFANAALVLLVICCGFTGILAGVAIDEDSPFPALLGITGTTLGAVAAVRLYRRRRSRT